MAGRKQARKAAPRKKKPATVRKKAAPARLPRIARRRPSPVVAALSQARTDLSFAAEASRAFFEFHGLPQLAQAVPAHVDPTPLAGPATVLGLDVALAFPPVSVQRAAFAAAVEALAVAPGADLEADQQYGPPQLDVATLQFAEVLHRPKGAYLLVLSSGPVPPSTRGASAERLRARFDLGRLGGLTPFEYLVVQRYFAERFGDHRFDGSHALWLLDAKVGGRVPVARWSPAARRVELSLSEAGSSAPDRGAVPTLVRGV